MLTPFGKALRKLRIDRGWRLKDMADGVDVTPSFLSAVETGRKSIPDNLVGRIAHWASLDEDEVRELNQVAEASKKEYSIKVQPTVPAQTAALLARFGELPEEDRKRIREILVRRLG